MKLSRLALAALGLSLLSLDAAALTTLSVTWRDLAPHANATSALNAPLSERLLGKDISLEGYLLPVDREGDLVYQFMLVPWVGACSHMPQPPVNQMILVTPSKPYKLAEIYEPISVAGTLKASAERTQFFLLDGVIRLDTQYAIGSAEVLHREGIAAPVAPGANPWKALTK